MRRCLVGNTLAPPRRRAYRTLRTSPHSRPRAVKQLNNAELLKIVQEGQPDEGTKLDSERKSDAIAAQDRDELIQTSSRLSARSPPLPRSPVTWPQLVSAHKVEKPPPAKERSPFQLKLEKNPYAQALSTPPRLCLLTGVRLPSYFQIPFGLAKHPETGAIWHLPRRSNLTSGPKGDPTPPPVASDSREAETDMKSSVRTASGTHIIASRNTLAHISNLTKPAYRRLLPYRWKEDSSLRTSEIVWREDMDAFVLEMLRQGVARDLQYLASRSAAYIAACKSYDTVSDHKQINAVLWLGSDSERSTLEASSDSTARSEDQGPPMYAMHRYKDHYVPCYNLLSLLGPLHTRAVKASKPTQLGARMAVIKAKRQTMRLQQDLWKLLGYLAQQEGQSDTADGLSDGLSDEGA